MVNALLKDPSGLNSVIFLDIFWNFGGRRKYPHFVDDYRPLHTNGLLSASLSTNQIAAFTFEHSRILVIQATAGMELVGDVKSSGYLDLLFGV